MRSCYRPNRSRAAPRFRPRRQPPARLCLHPRHRGLTRRTAGCDLQSRMFTPRLLQDPATGSATAALAGLLAELGSGPEVRLRVGQGGDMGRSSLLAARGPAHG